MGEAVKRTAYEIPLNEFLAEYCERCNHKEDHEFHTGGVYWNAAEYEQAKLNYHQFIPKAFVPRKHSKKDV